MNALSWLGAWLHQAVTENLGLKVMALVLSVGLFGYIHAQEDVMERTIPVSVISVPPVGGDRELMSRIPPSIHITLRASARSVAELLQKGVTPVEVDLREGYPESVEFSRDMFLLPRDVELVLVDPPRLDLEWAGLRVSVPVKVDTAAHVKAAMDKTLGEAWRPHYTAGRYLLESGGDLDQALKYFDTSIGIQPTWWSHWFKAQALAKKGRAADAVAAAEKAQQLGAGDNIFQQFFKEDVQKAIDGWKKPKS